MNNKNTSKYQQIKKQEKEDEEEYNENNENIIESTYITNSISKNNNNNDIEDQNGSRSNNDEEDDEFSSSSSNNHYSKNKNNNSNNNSTSTSSPIFNSKNMENNIKRKKFRDCSKNEIRKNARSIFWIFVWVTLNVGLVFSNKYLFTKTDPFKFPVFIILTGTFITFIGSCIAIFIFKISKFPSISTLLKYKYLLSLTSILQAATYVSENISIVFLPISLNQILKSTGPAFVIFLLFIIYRETFSKEIIVSAIIIIFGAAFTTLENPSFNTYGFLLATLSSASASLQTILIQKLLKDTELNALSVVLVTSLPSTIVIIPIFFIVEFQDLKEWTGNPVIPIVFVIALALAAAFYNISHFYIVKYTSALYFVIVGNAKVVFVVILSSIIWTTKFSTINIIGMVMTFIGFFSYNYFKYQEAQAKIENIVESDPILSSSFSNETINQSNINGDSL